MTLISASRAINYGAFVGESSAGVKLASMLHSNWGTVYVYSDLDGTPTIEDSVSASTVHGTTMTCRGLHGVIDSSDNIHIISCAHNGTGTRDICYFIATESAGSWSLGGYEEVEAYDNDPDVAVWENPSIDIDSNDKPHLVYTNYPKVHGTVYGETRYSEKTGASWSTPVAITGGGTNFYATQNRCFSLKASNNGEVVISDVTNSDILYAALTSGTWGSPSTYTGTYGNRDICLHVTVTTGGTVYRYFINSTGYDILENDSDTTYNVSAWGAAPYLDGSGGRFIIYMNASSDYAIIYNTGSGWTSGGTIISAGANTLENIIVGWAYNNLNNTTTIDYLYNTAEGLDNLYWGEYTLPAGTDNLTANSISTTPVVGNPTLGQEHDLTATGISTTPVVGNPTLTEVDDLTANSISTTPVVGNPTAGHIHNLDATGISTTPVVDNPDIGQEHALDATGISTTPVVDNPDIGQEHALDATGISTTPVLDTPTVAEGHNLDATGISTTPVVDNPDIGQEHALDATGISTTPVVDNPDIGQEHALDATGISTTPVLDTPTLAEAGGQDDLTATGISTTPTVDNPTLEHIHDLSANGITTTPTVDNPTLEHIHDLSANGITTTPILDTPTLGEGAHALDANSITTTPVLGTPSLGQIHTLTATGITATPELDVPTFGQIHILDAIGLTVPMTEVVGVPSIGQIHSMDPNDISVSPVVDNPIMIQIHVLDAVGITTTPIAEEASFDLVEGEVIIEWSAIYPEIEFSTV